MSCYCRPPPFLTFNRSSIAGHSPSHKAIRRDARINWIANPVHKHREARGLTSIGKQNRGVRLFPKLPSRESLIADTHVPSLSLARDTSTTRATGVLPGRST